MAFPFAFSCKLNRYLPLNILRKLVLSNDNIAKITFTKLAHSSHHTKYTPAIKTIYVVTSFLVKEKTNPETDNRLPDLFIILINIWLQPCCRNRVFNYQSCFSSSALASARSWARINSFSVGSSSSFFLRFFIISDSLISSLLATIIVWNSRIPVPAGIR